MGPIEKWCGEQWEEAVRTRRNKVDGLLTLCPGGESNRELSGAGRRADLYSSFGLQRNTGGLSLVNRNTVSLVQVCGQILGKGRQ